MPENFKTCKVVYIISTFYTHCCTVTFINYSWWSRDTFLHLIENLIKKNLKQFVIPRIFACEHLQSMGKLVKKSEIKFFKDLFLFTRKLTLQSTRRSCSFRDTKNMCIIIMATPWSYYSYAADTIKGKCIKTLLKKQGYRNSYICVLRETLIRFVVELYGFGIFYIDTVDPVWRVCYRHVTERRDLIVSIIPGAVWRDSIPRYDPPRENLDSTRFAGCATRLTGGAHIFKTRMPVVTPRFSIMWVEDDLLPLWQQFHRQQCFRSVLLRSGKWVDYWRVRDIHPLTK